jgi:hypothetical protein
MLSSANYFNVQGKTVLHSIHPMSLVGSNNNTEINTAFVSQTQTQRGAVSGQHRKQVVLQT